MCFFSHQTDNTFNQILLISLSKWCVCLTIFFVYDSFVCRRGFRCWFSVLRFDCVMVCDDDGWFWLDFSRAENGRCCLLSSVVFLVLVATHNNQMFLQCGRFISFNVFFSRNCVAASSFVSHSVWLVSDVCMCLVHIRFYICVGHLFGIGHIKLKWLGLEGWPLENQNRRRFICQSSFNDLSGIFIACKFATIHQYLCGFRRIL